MMNILKYNQYLQIRLFNLGFFGYGRHGKSMKIDGHYTVYLNTDTNKFAVWKHGDYAGFTTIKKLPLKFLKINEAERKFLNDIIYRRDIGRVTDLSDPIWNGIYDDEKALMKKLDKLPQEYWFQYEGKRISPSIQQGDIVKNTEDGRIFRVNDTYDLKILNMLGDQYVIVGRDQDEIPVNV